MKYFNEFEKLLYKFGNEESTVAFQDISLYVDVIDQIKDNLALYNEYTIPGGTRPDQLAIQLYRNPLYYWTFFLMNDSIRARGWPLTNSEIEVLVKRDFSHIAVTTRDNLTGIFKVGQTVTGSSSGVTGTVKHRHVDLGQIFIESSSLFTAGEQLQSNVVVEGATITQTINVHSSEYEYNAAHHYENADGEWVDIDPAIGPGAQLVEITNWDRYYNENEELKRIRIIKPESINQLVSTYKKALRS